MASEEIKVKLTFEDKATKKAEAATRKLSENTKRAVGETRKAIDVQKELNKQIKSFLMNTIGFMAMVRGVAELKKGLIDAGLQTDKLQKAFVNVRTTIAAQLLPDVQLFVDAIAGANGELAQLAGATTQAILVPFKYLTVGVLQAGVLVNKTLNMLGIGNMRDRRVYIEMLNEEIDDLVESTKKSASLALSPSSIAVKSPKATGDKKSRSIEILTGGLTLADMEKAAKELQQMIVDAHGGYVDSWEDTDFFKNQEAMRLAVLELQADFENMAIAQIEDYTQREVAALDKRYELLTITHIDNQEYLKQLAINYEYERALIDQKGADLRQKSADLENQQIISAADQAYNATTSLLKQGIEQSKMAAEEKKAILLAIAIAEGAATTITAAKAGWNAGGDNPYLGTALAALYGAAAAAAAGTNIMAIENAKFARGGQFVTSGPMNMTVGDNPGGREMVTVTPLSSTNFEGPGAGVSVGDTIININGGLSGSDNRRLKSTLREHRREIERMARYGYLKPSRIGVN